MTAGRPLARSGARRTGIGAVVAGVSFGHSKRRAILAAVWGPFPAHSVLSEGHSPNEESVRERVTAWPDYSYRVRVSGDVT